MQASRCACIMDTLWRPSAAVRSLRELRHALLDCLLPPHCCACGDRLAERIGRGRMCRPCRATLETLPATGCVRCGELAGGDGSAKGRCGDDHRAIAGLAFAVAAFRYRGAGGAIARRLKLQGDFSALGEFASAMADALAPRLDGRFRRPTLVSVPLHARRRRQRGFDQAALLAEAVAGKLGLVAAHGALARVRSTIPQGDARVASREQNVADAFAVVRPVAVAGRAVVLVDDVMTSGATARECAARLVDAGARCVALLTGCRARNPSVVALAPSVSSAARARTG